MASSAYNLPLLISYDVYGLLCLVVKHCPSNRNRFTANALLYSTAKVQYLTMQWHYPRETINSPTTIELVEQLNRFFISLLARDSETFFQ